MVVVKTLFLVLAGSIGLLAQTTQTITRDPDQSLNVIFKNASIPTSPTSITTTQYRVFTINLINNNGSTVHCTIKDQDPNGAVSLIPDLISIPANTQYVWQVYGVPANGGMTWSCDTSSVVGRIAVKP
jgi:hypothetical protein